MVEIEIVVSIGVMAYFRIEVNKDINITLLIEFWFSYYLFFGLI